MPAHDNIITNPVGHHAAQMSGLILCLLLFVNLGWADNHPDILTVTPDLKDLLLTGGEPTPGKMVLQQLPNYLGSEVAHTLYLPTDWEPGKKFPVIIEYRGNNSWVRCGGGLGYGLSGGKGFIWAVLPYVSPDHKSDMDGWWGDVAATVAYAKQAVPAICQEWGGDPNKVILTGHSRGAIACNFIGLHDDNIAKLWRAMIPISHYDDGHTGWGMTKAEMALSRERLQRLGTIPQLICGEYHLPIKHKDKTLLELIRVQQITSFAIAKEKLLLHPMIDLEGTRRFITANLSAGNITFLDLPYVNHSCAYVMCDIPERKRIREWMEQVLK